MLQYICDNKKAENLLIGLQLLIDHLQEQAPSRNVSLKIIELKEQVMEIKNFLPNDGPICSYTTYEPLARNTQEKKRI